MNQILSAEISEKPVANPDQEFDLRPILFRWEMWRIVYNVILVVLVVGATMVRDVSLFTDVGYLERLVFRALIANACFLFGPIADAYLKWFQIWHIALSVALFIAGTLLTAVYALVVVHIYPGFVAF